MENLHAMVLLLLKDKEKSPVLLSVHCKESHGHHIFHLYLPKSDGLSSPTPFYFFLCLFYLLFVSSFYSNRHPYIDRRDSSFSVLMNIFFKGSVLISIFSTIFNESIKFKDLKPLCQKKKKRIWNHSSIGMTILFLTNTRFDNVIANKLDSIVDKFIFSRGFYSW